MRRLILGIGFVLFALGALALALRSWLAENALDRVLSAAPAIASRRGVTVDGLGYGTVRVRAWPRSVCTTCANGCSALSPSGRSRSMYGWALSRCDRRASPI
jgi:hypothetical protein